MRDDIARGGPAVVPSGLLLSVLFLTAACGEGAFDHPMLEQRREMRRAPVYALDEPVPDLRLPNVKGDSVDLRTVTREGITVLNLWATWCVPCRDEMPELVRLHERRGREGVRVVGIAVASELEGIRAWIDRYGIDFPTLHGMSRHEKASAFGGMGVPRTYVVRNDTLRLGMIGARTLEQLEAAVDSVRGTGG